MRLLELVKLLMENKDLIIQLIEFIRTFLPSDGAQQMVFTTMTAEAKFPELAAVCAAQNVTLEELFDVAVQVNTEKLKE